MPEAIVYMTLFYGSYLYENQFKWEIQDIFEWRNGTSNLVYLAEHTCWWFFHIWEIYNIKQVLNSIQNLLHTSKNIIPQKNQKLSTHYTIYHKITLQKPKRLTFEMYNFGWVYFMYFIYLKPFIVICIIVLMALAISKNSANER